MQTDTPAASAAQSISAAPITNDPTFVIGKRYYFVHPIGQAFIYDYRGVKTRGRHAGEHHFEHRQKKNWLGDMYLPPGHHDLPRIQIYVPHDDGTYTTIPNTKENRS